MAATTLSVSLQPSRYLAGVLVCAHVLVCGLLWLMPLPVAGALSGTCVVCASLVCYIRRDALLSASGAVIRVELSEDMTGTLILRDGRRITGKLTGNTFVHPGMTVLDFAISRFLTRSVVILPDGIEAEIFRQLRVWLIWKQAVSAG